LELAVKYKSKFLQASTSSVYGEPLKQLKFFQEDYWGFVNAVGPRSDYNEGKRFSECLAYNYGEHYDFPTKIARIFQTYGPRMKFEDARLIPDMVKSALKSEPMVIYGDKNYTTSFLYISDLIDGLIKYMESDYNGVLNLGYPKEYKIQDAAEIIKKLTGSSSQIKFEDPPLFTMKHGLPNVNLAKEKLGWFPLTDLQKGLQKTVEYMQAQKDLLNI